MPGRAEATAYDATIVDDAYITRVIRTLPGSEIVRERRFARMIVNYPALVRFVASDRNLTVGDTRHAIREWATRYGQIDDAAKPPVIEIDRDAWERLVEQHIPSG